MDKNEYSILLLPTENTGQVTVHVIVYDYSSTVQQKGCLWLLLLFSPVTDFVNTENPEERKVITYC